MNFFKKLLGICALLILVSAVNYSQTVHQVAEGDSTLAAAIADAADGDIIELVTDGGLYTNPNQIDIDKSLTIRAHEQLSNKPVVKYTGSSTSAHMFRIRSGPNVTFMGLDLAGDGTAEGAAKKAKYILRIDSSEDSLTAMVIKVMDCMLHDTQDKIVKPYKNTGIDSLIFTNTTFYNSDKEAVTLHSGSSSDPKVHMDYAEFYNCTFYSITREAIKGDTNPDTKALINHCTFYDIGGPDKPFIYMDDLTDVEIKNSIFQKNLETGNFVRLESDANTFHHNIFWDVVDKEVDNTVNVSDTLFADPLFEDPANANFMLQAGSPAIGFADDGKAAGDLRWDPTAGDPVIHRVEEGTDVLKAAIDAANPGDIIELTTSGGMYLSNDQIDIDKSITIRANEFLAQKPVLKYIGESTSAHMFRIHSGPNVFFMGLDFAGDGTTDGAAKKAKYILRIDSSEDSLTAMIIKVDDCILHDTQDKLVKPYKNTGIDSLIFTNTTFYNSDKEAVTLNSGSSSDPKVHMKYAEFYNCTFYSITREAIKGDTNPDTKALINQCTFYDIGGPDKPFIYMDDLQDVEIKNSIFQKNLETGNFVRLESDANTFHHNVIWDVVDWEVDNTVNVSDTLRADPLFMNPANADFTLGESSPARTAAEGGTPAGDLRWAIDPNAVVVSVITVGKGIVTLDPPGGVYQPGTQVTFTATADLNWEFSGWNGLNVFPPDANPATVTVNENMEVTATFISLTPQVTLDIATLGLGTVETDPEVGDDGTFDEGSQVTLTAVPENGWEFVEWLGDIAGTENPIVAVLDSNMAVTASFRSTAPQVTLTVIVEGMGDVSLSPEPILGTYDVNTVVTLSAEAAIGWNYVGMTGDLTSTANVDSLTMDNDKTVTVTFEEANVPGGVLEVEATWDLMDIISFANNNSQVHTVELITSGGVYTTNKSGTAFLKVPLTITASTELEAKPIITNTDPLGVEGTIDILRVFNDLTLENVIIDGSTEYSAGMKYGVRYSNSDPPDTVKWGSNAIFRNVDFRHLYDDGKATGDGHALKIDREMILGLVKFENCTFYDIGYEAIRISDTEKWQTDRALDSLVVRNCTFTEIDAEGIRYYSDADPATPDVPVLVEHCTFNSTATRIMYLKNSGGAVVRDLIIANSRESGHGRDDDLMDVQGSGSFSSMTSHVNIWNTPDVPIKSTDAEVDSATIYNLDPQFVDPENMDYTLPETSPMYGMAHDSTALGDLNWATNEPVSVEDEKMIPTVFSIDQNYPNPFNPATSIRFGLPVSATVTLQIFDILGRLVTTIYDGVEMNAGYHKVQWNGQNNYGSKVATGIYFYRINSVGVDSKNFVNTKKMILMK